MRWKFLIRLLFFAIASQVSALAIAPAHIVVKGTPYTALSDLAAKEKMQLQCARRGKKASLKSKHKSNLHLSFEVNRRDVSWNDITLWLCHPIVAEGFEFYISESDVQKSLKPILGSVPSHPVHRIVLDPGHGGINTGAQYKNLVEKTLTLDIALRIKRILERKGYLVLLTRSSDRAVDLTDRTEYAAKQKADLFVSIHINSEARIPNRVHGIEVFTLAPAGQPSSGEKRAPQEYPASARGNLFDTNNMQLGFCIYDSLIRRVKAGDRGLKRSRFKVLKEAPCPAVLIECGFIAHSYESRLLQKPEYRQKLADAIAMGIESYKLGSKP